MDAVYSLGQTSATQVLEAIPACDSVKQYYDVRLASSLEPGGVKILLWASRRISESTLKVRDQFPGHGKPVKMEHHGADLVKGS